MLSHNFQYSGSVGQSPFGGLGVVEAVVGLVVAGVVSSGVAAETAVQVIPFASMHELYPQSSLSEQQKP